MEVTNRNKSDFIHKKNHLMSFYIFIPPPPTLLLLCVSYHLNYRYMDFIISSLLRSIILKLKLSYKSFTSHYCYMRHTGSYIGRGTRHSRVSEILWSCTFHGVWIFFSPLSLSVYFCILFNKKLPPFDQILRKVVLGNAKYWSNKLF